MLGSCQISGMQKHARTRRAPAGAPETLADSCVTLPSVVRVRAPQLLRVSEVSRLTTLSRTTIWRLERAGTFPSRRKLSANAVAWLLEEVERWIETRAARSAE